MPCRRQDAIYSIVNLVQYRSVGTVVRATCKVCEIKGTLIYNHYNSNYLLFSEKCKNTVRFGASIDVGELQARKNAIICRLPKGKFCLLGVLPDLCTMQCCLGCPARSLVLEKHPSDESFFRCCLVRAHRSQKTRNPE